MGKKEGRRNFIYLWNMAHYFGMRGFVVCGTYFWFLFSRLVYFCLHLSKYWRYTYCFAFASRKHKDIGDSPIRKKRETKIISHAATCCWIFQHLSACVCVVCVDAVTFTLLTGVPMLHPYAILSSLYLAWLLLKLLLRYAWISLLYSNFACFSSFCLSTVFFCCFFLLLSLAFAKALLSSAAHFQSSMCVASVIFLSAGKCDENVELITQPNRYCLLSSFLGYK